MSHLVLVVHVPIIGFSAICLSLVHVSDEIGTGVGVIKGKVFTGASAVVLSIMAVVDERDGHDTCEQRQRSSGISVYGRISVFSGLVTPI